jgi:hypothetical protein
MLIRWMRCISWVLAQVDEIYQADVARVYEMCLRLVVAQVDEMYLRWDVRKRMKCISGGNVALVN